MAESPGADPAQLGRVRDLREQLLAEDADGRLLDRLDEIRLKRAEANPRTNQFASGRTRPMYRKAFADYGLDPTTTDAQQATAKIKGRPAHVAEACVFSLESWRSPFSAFPTAGSKSRFGFLRPPWRSGKQKPPT